MTRALAFLFLDYNQEYFFFELVLMATKITLVGFATMITPTGSIVQIMFGLLVALGQLVLLASTKPYARRINNATAIGCSLVLVCVFLACLQIKVRELVETTPDQVMSLLAEMYDVPEAYITAFLLASTGVAFGIAIALCVVHLWSTQNQPVARTRNGRVVAAPLFEGAEVSHRHT